MALPVPKETTGVVSLDQVTSPYITGLVYGGPGVGKTIFAGGSQTRRTLIFDVDKGTMSLASLKTNERLAQGGLPPIQRNLINVWPVKTYKDFENGLVYLYHNLHHYDLVVVDTLTELQRMIIQEVMAKHNHIVADQRDWGIILSTMEKLTTIFRDLGMHCIMLAHEVEATDQITQARYFRASFKGQFGQEYRKHFSWIARYLLVDRQMQDPQTKAVVTQTIRCLECHRTNANDAKDRSSSLEVYEHPNIDVIFHKILSTIGNTI